MTRKKIAVVGAGFFGLSAARFLAGSGNEITVFEKDEDAMLSASSLNQARVHAGYHYPRSLSTAARSRKNYIRFLNEYSGAINENFESMYAIAIDSKVSPYKFERFMQLIDAPYTKQKIPKFLNPELIQSVYKVEETAFDSFALRDLLKEQLSKMNVQILYSSEIRRIRYVHKDKISLLDNYGREFHFDGIVVATYGVDKIEGLLEFKNNLLFEACEIVEVKSPSEFVAKGLTIMDGPYWSLTPWPAMDNHVLTHVRHTPHARFSQPAQAVSYLKQIQFSRAEIMIREVAKYAPQLANLQIERSHYVIKTVLARRDFDDARPIVVKKNFRIMSLIGSKIDNVYDMEEPLMEFLGNL